MKTRQQKNKEKDHIAKLKVKHRKDFFEKLKMVCDLFGGPDLWALFPVHYIEVMYASRVHNFQIVAAEGSNISKKELDRCDYIIRHFVEVNYITLNDGEQKVSIALQMSVGETLLATVRNYTGNEFPGASEIKERLKEYNSDSGYYQRFAVSLANMLFAFSAIQSDLASKLMWSTFSMEFISSIPAIKAVFYINTLHPARKTFIVDGHARPAIRVAWKQAFDEFTYPQLKPSQLGVKEIGEDLPMDVYIQSHALIRIGERIGNVTGVMHHAITLSLINLDCQTDEHGRLLIGFMFFGKKVGYLVSSIQDGYVLIHTFLFLTNNGTPEGKKLFKLTGLQRMDKKYLAIDKLSTFMEYNINDNEFVKNIFIEAGCSSILELPDIRDLVLGYAPNPSDAGIIAKYLIAHKPAASQENIIVKESIDTP